MKESIGATPAGHTDHSLLREGRIPAYTLRDRVKIEGKSLWGVNTTLGLEPAGKPGWHLRVTQRNSDRGDIPITSDLLRDGRNHLFLEHEGRAYLRVCEHLLPLRFAGIDGICVVPDQRTEWMPWSQGGLNFWRAVASQLIPTEPLKPMGSQVKIGRKVVSGGLQRSAHMHTTEKGTHLTATSRVDYAKFGGVHEVTRRYPDDLSNMYDLFSVKTLGQPPLLEHVLKLAAAAGWPHKETILWPKWNMMPSKVLEQLSLHRHFDMLGAAALMAGPGEFPTGTLKTHEANHTLDVELVRAVVKVLGGRD